MLAGFVTVYGQKTTFRGTKTQVETSFERQMLDMALKHLEEEGCDAADSGVNGIWTICCCLAAKTSSPSTESQD